MNSMIHHSNEYAANARYQVPGVPSLLSSNSVIGLASGEHIPLTRPQAYLNNFLSGALALSTSFAIMHPLDTLKTRMQASGSSGFKLNSMLTRETLRVLSKGFVASVAGAGPQGGARLATYELTKSFLLHTPSSSTRSHPNPLWIPTMSPIPASAISAIIGDLASSVIKVPREVITARLQTDHYGGQGAMFAIRQIISTEGISGLFRGFWSTTARDAPFMVILFTTYEKFKAYHHETTIRANKEIDEMWVPVEPRIPTFKSTLYGGISGALAGYLTTPFDVIKTKIMTQKPVHASSSMTDYTRLIYQQAVHANESTTRNFIRVYQAFFVGAVPRSSWWFCVCSMFFPIYETTKEYLSVNDR
ncbi:hypothetical protein K7432_010872 [Basidiobolus ranarum]|uniref:Mitochondrial carrier protein n=1 Tax=Basidiobolus ranarum TaxID=34480 RepID=A0ABR2VUR4_9FUNG